MNKIEKYINERFYNFWGDIYPIEKEQFYAFYDYIKYIEDNCITYTYPKSKYIYYKNFFMRKFIDYLHEAFSSLLLGNYNAYSCAMRIIIENYVCFYFIKKYQEEKLWKDWYIFSLKKILLKQEKNMKTNDIYIKHYQKFKKIYESECKRLNIDGNIYNVYDSYSWLCRVIKPNPKNKKYDFRYVSSLVDEIIYNDYDRLSDNIHNIDYIIKNDITLMEKLCNYLVILFNYTDFMVMEYNLNIYKRHEYSTLRENVLYSLMKCFKEWEVPV